jgi:predicted GNAT superfamily acetyltransferase
MAAVEDLQRKVWSEDDIDIVPAHLLITAAHNGGLLIGAFAEPGEPAGEDDYDLSLEPPSWSSSKMVGFVFGFPGLYFTPDGPRPKHCSHMLAVIPDYHNQGVGFSLKRAQWQMVRNQGLDRITWTFDPLLSRNAYLNIVKLGGVSNTYLRNIYGEMRDGLNAGLASDRFQVDWWVNSQRVNRRLGKRARLRLDLAHFLSAGAEIINPTHPGPNNWPVPAEPVQVLDSERTGEAPVKGAVVLVEIPADFIGLKAADPLLAADWRMHTRSLFEDLFDRGYLVTDFVTLDGAHGRSFYVLSYGEKTF